MRLPFMAESAAAALTAAAAGRAEQEAGPRAADRSHRGGSGEARCARRRGRGSGRARPGKAGSRVAGARARL